MSAALLFKNFIKKNWPESEQEPSKISSQIAAELKRQIVDVMLMSPSNIRVQLSQAISEIAKHDFPERWPDLLSQLLARMSPQNFDVNNGILHTAHSVFKRYKHEFRSDELFLEIKYVLEQFANPLLELFRLIDNMLQSTSDRNSLIILLESLCLCLKIFFCLSSQDIPEFFEDHLDEFMGVMLKYYSFQNYSLGEIVEKVQTKIAQIINLYALKYEEVFPMLPHFVEKSWEMLTTIGLDSRFDKLVSNSMNIIATVARQERHKSIFHKPNIIETICDKIIVPNVELRDSDLEVFEDEPIEFIRKDMEGSNHNSRRIAASDMIKGLMEHFEEEVSKIISNYISLYLQEYKSNTKRWKRKDAAIFLFNSVAIKSSVSFKGVTKVNPRFNIVSFFSENIISDLQSESIHPILKVDGIKYFEIFRYQLTKEQLLQVLPLIVGLMNNQNYVIYTYSAISIEKILSIRNGGVDLLSSQEILPFSEAVITRVMNLLSSLIASPKLSENDYLVKTLMRMIFILKSDIFPLFSTIMKQLCSFISIVAKNPSNPQFNHYLFESLCALINYCGKGQNVESVVFPCFQIILTEDITEFSPYVFQILSLMLEQKGSPSVEPYASLFSMIMQPAVWSIPANIPALVKLLQSYIVVDPSFIISTNQLAPILGIFQILVNSKHNDVHGFALVNILVQKLDFDILKNYFPSLLVMMLKRLSTSKTSRFLNAFLLFICNFLAFSRTANSSVIISMFDSIQPGLFRMVVESCIAPESQKLVDLNDKALCTVAIGKLLSSPSLVESDYVSLWPKLMYSVTALLKHYNTKATDAADEDLMNEEMSYQAAYYKLNSMSKSSKWPALPNPIDFLKMTVEQVARAYPSKFTPLMSSQLESSQLVEVQEFLRSIQVTI